MAHLKAKPNEDVPAVELHRVGSGKENGFCASLSRRVSDIRQMGFDLIVSIDRRMAGQRQTFYKLRTAPKQGELL